MMATMMLILVAILMIAGPLAALLFFIGAPLFAGLMAYDVIEKHRAERAEQPVAEPEILLPTPLVEPSRLTA